MTKLQPDGTVMPIYDAAMEYKKRGVPLVIFGGKEYGTGSSRDWAAKGTLLLGVKAVIVESFERIHRSNLVGMGVLAAAVPRRGQPPELEADRRRDDRHHRRRRRPQAAHGADDAHPRPGWRRRARRRSSAASIRSTRSNTSATAASCNTCCAASLKQAA